MSAGTAIRGVSIWVRVLDATWGRRRSGAGSAPRGGRDHAPLSLCRPVRMRVRGYGYGCAVCGLGQGARRLCGLHLPCCLELPASLSHLVRLVIAGLPHREALLLMAHTEHLAIPCSVLRDHSWQDRRDPRLSQGSIASKASILLAILSLQPLTLGFTPYWYDDECRPV